MGSIDLKDAVDKVFKSNRELASKIIKIIGALWRNIKSAGVEELKIMNFCGTHEWTTTHYGLRALLPDGIDMVAGPGCPVCITPSFYVESAVKLALEGVRVYSYGDAYRLPAVKKVNDVKSLAEARSMGGRVIGLVGGTGNLGRGLALRLAKASQEVVIGSRYKEKAETIAKEVTEKICKKVQGLTNEDAARISDVIILTIPFEGIRNIIEKISQYLEGKTVISTIVPPIFSEKSAAEVVRELLPRTVYLASAFHNIGYKALLDLEKDVECDVAVCGDEPAKKIAIELAEKIPGVRAFDCGPIEYSRIIENFTHLLIYMNKRYRKKGVSLRFTGI